MAIYLFRTLIILFYFIVALNLNSFSQNQVTIDSIENLLTQYSLEGKDSLQSDALNQLALFYQNNDIKKAILYCKQGVELGEKTNNFSIKSDWYGRIGFIYKSLGIYTLALENYQKGIKLSEENGRHTGWWHINIGNIYYLNSSNYNKAIEYYNKAIKDFKEIERENTRDYTLGMAVAFNGIGMSHEKKKKYNKALNYFRQAYTLRQELRSNYELSHSCLLIGSVYNKIGNKDSALLYYHKGIVYTESSENKEFAIEIYLKKAFVFSEEGDFKQALTECSYAEKIVFEINNIRNLPLVYLSFSEIYYKEKKYNRALDYALNGKIMADSINDNAFMPVLLKQLVSVSEKLNNIPAAYNYLKQYQVLEDKIKKQDVEKLQLNFEIEQNEKEVTSLKQNIDKLRSKNRIKLWFILLTSLLFVGTNIFLVSLRIKRKNEKKSEKALKIAKEKAEESDRLKSAFLANMSHEIRTPMNAIQGFTWLLKDPAKTYEQRVKYLDLMQKNSNQLMQIIDDILDISKLDAGHVKFIEKKCSVNSIFDDLFILFNTKIKAGENKIELRYTNDLTYEESFILTDALRLQQILTNLISNAIKFTFGGYVNFGCKINNKHTLEFFVKDTGIGIPAGKQKLIFERFGQVENTISRKYSGAGLGLAISKNLVNLLGGKIWFESKENEGTTFYFTIPYKPSGKIIAIKEEVISSKKYNWLHKIILIVDDDIIHMEYLKQILEGTKVQVITAVNGNKAVELCYTNLSINLVLMDIMLPCMDGLKATTLIKQSRKDLPIIAHTANVQIENKEKSIEAGCNEFITKPIDSNELLSMIEKYFKQ